MASEHVRISEQERLYGGKNMLETQLHLLSSIKRMRLYKNLRKEELAMRIIVKSKIDEAVKLISEMEKILPETNYKEEKKEKVIKVKTTEKPQEKLEKHEKTIEDEIEQIKNKLATLRQSS